MNVQVDDLKKPPRIINNIEKDSTKIRYKRKKKKVSKLKDKENFESSQREKAYSIQGKLADAVSSLWLNLCRSSKSW